MPNARPDLARPRHRGRFMAALVLLAIGAGLAYRRSSRLERHREEAVRPIALPPPHFAPGLAGGKPRRVGLWLVGTLVLLALAAGIAIAYETWSAQQQQRRVAVTRTGGNPDNAPALLVRYGCADCHNIPGLSAPTGDVGPDLTGVGRRAYIAGVVANTPANLVHWIVDPQSIDPKSAMPVTGITPAEARDVAAYLYAAP